MILVLKQLVKALIGKVVISGIIDHFILISRGSRGQRV